MTKANILSIPIVAEKPETILRTIDTLLISGKSAHIVTANPEILVRTTKDTEYAQILRSADMCIPDGFGIILVNKITGGPTMHRVTGVELTEHLLTKATREKYQLLCIVSQAGITDKENLQRALNTDYPTLSCFVYYDTEPDLLKKINGHKARIILVGTGAPSQEKWIRAHKRSLPDSRILVGVGGTFDFISGSIKRAPRLFQILGIEWMWRLFQRPPKGIVKRGRLRRILTAVFIFPYLALIKS